MAGILKKTFQIFNYHELKLKQIIKWCLIPVFQCNIVYCFLRVWSIHDYNKLKRHCKTFFWSSIKNCARLVDLMQCSEWKKTKRRGSEETGWSFGQICCLKLRYPGLLLRHFTYRTIDALFETNINTLCGRQNSFPGLYRNMLRTSLYYPYD